MKKIYRDRSLGYSQEEKFDIPQLAPSAKPVADGDDEGESGASPGGVPNDTESFFE